MLVAVTVLALWGTCGGGGRGSGWGEGRRVGLSLRDLQVGVLSTRRPR